MRKLSTVQASHNNVVGLTVRGVYRSSTIIALCWSHLAMCKYVQALANHIPESLRSQLFTQIQ